MTARPNRMHMLTTPAQPAAHLVGREPISRLREHGADGAARPGQPRAVMPRRLALAAALAALVVPLAACGRKASPDPPPGVPKDAFPKSYPPKGT
ncbi:MAG TPA: hypothetical protein VGZ72_16105 [Stellaceae bacterium]|nr:hypothetical protein [Stellaceae bacterium]